MKFDWTLAKTILIHIEAETFREFITDTESLKQWKEGQLLSKQVNNSEPPERRVVLTHVKLLRDGGFLTGIDVRESLRADGFIPKLKKFAQDNAVPLTLETLKTLSSAFIKNMF